jgi:hypothetical protein
MRALSVIAAFAISTICLADTITLKNGRVVNGTYLGGTARQVRVDTGDQVRTFDVADIARIDFGDAASPAPPPEGPPPMPPAPTASVSRGPSGPPAAPLGVTLPAGTNIVIRMIDAVDSQTARQGQNFQGSLDEPLVDSSGGTLIPRGADVVLKLVDAKQSGKIAGRTELALSLMQIRVNGQMVDINTQTVTKMSDSRAGRSAKTIGGGAVAGAVIGGIIGGGKGAATGAAIGGGAGTAYVLTTAGKPVVVSSGAAITARLATAVDVKVPVK